MGREVEKDMRGTGGGENMVKIYCRKNYFKSTSGGRGYGSVIIAFIVLAEDLPEFDSRRTT